MANQRVVYLSLILLDTMMQRCGNIAAEHVGTKDFMAVLVSILQ